MHLPPAVKGLPVLCPRVVGAASPGRKQRKVNAIRRRCRLPAREISDFVRGLRGLDRAQRYESSRVRPDSVLCCIVQRFTGQPMIPCRSRSQVRGRGDAGMLRSTRKRAETSRVTTGWAASESVWLTRMDEGAPGRGSRVRFTLCEVSRSWRCECSESSFIQTARSFVVRQGRQRWRGPWPLGEKKTLDRGHAEPTEARNGVVKRRPHRCHPSQGGESTRKPTGSGCPFDSRDGQKSVVRISGSSIHLRRKTARWATGGSSNGSSHVMSTHHGPA